MRDNLSMVRVLLIEGNSLLGTLKLSWGVGRGVALSGSNSLSHTFWLSLLKEWLLTLRYWCNTRSNKGSSFCGAYAFWLMVGTELF